MLFGHSHGFHPSAQKIAMHHAIMGTMALTAGSSKLFSTWFTPTPEAAAVRNGIGFGRFHPPDRSTTPHLFRISVLLHRAHCN